MRQSAHLVKEFRLQGGNYKKSCRRTRVCVQGVAGHSRQNVVCY